MPGRGSQSPHPTSGPSLIQQDKDGGRNGVSEDRCQLSGRKAGTQGLGNRFPHLNRPRRVHTISYICRLRGLVGREEGENAQGLQQGWACSSEQGGRGKLRGLRAPAAGGASRQVTPVLGQVLRGPGPWTTALGWGKFQAGGRLRAQATSEDIGTREGMWGLGDRMMQDPGGGSQALSGPTSSPEVSLSIRLEQRESPIRPLARL